MTPPDLWSQLPDCRGRISRHMELQRHAAFAHVQRTHCPRETPQRQCCYRPESSVSICAYLSSISSYLADPGGRWRDEGWCQQVSPAHSQVIFAQKDVKANSSQDAGGLEVEMSVLQTGANVDITQTEGWYRRQGPTCLLFLSSATLCRRPGRVSKPPLFSF